MMLAQIESLDNGWLKNLAIFITCLSATAFYIKGLVSTKQKREVSFTETPASKREFDQFTATTNANFVQVREEMKQDRYQNQVHASERSKSLFNELKETRSELLHRTDAIRSELSDKIDGMEQRVIATLKNTGAI